MANRQKWRVSGRNGATYIDKLDPEGTGISDTVYVGRSVTKQGAEAIQRVLDEATKIAFREGGEAASTPLIFPSVGKTAYEAKHRTPLTPYEEVDWPVASDWQE